jgi:hypothetical protein
MTIVNRGNGPRERDIEFKPDFSAERVRIEMPITHAEREPDHRPTAANMDSWQACRPIINSDGAWQAKDLCLLLPASPAEIRQKKTGRQTDAYGGDAGRTLKVAILDRHVAATIIFTCAQCSDIALAIEVVDAENHTLTFYRRGASGAWVQVHLPDAIVEEMVMVRQLFMSMLPAAEAYVKQIGDEASQA